MTKQTDEARQVAFIGASNMYGAGFNLAILGIMLGAGFFIQWAVYLIIIGYAASRVINAGADAVDWVSGGLTAAKNKVTFWK